jgi:class 3 adenylate cyclase/tetratricopeptide (TPR) repeat protein
MREAPVRGDGSGAMGRGGGGLVCASVADDQEQLVGRTGTQPDLVQALASFVPPAVARAIHAERQPRGSPGSEHCSAVALLADVSGFTALTGELAALGAPGVEELTTLVNRYFTRMIGLLEAAGAEVVQFSGDALLALLRAPSAVALPRVAVQANAVAAQMQAAMAEFEHVPTSVGERGLAMKIVLGAGTVQTLSVGGRGGRWQYLVAGDPLRQIGAAEQYARRGEVVLSPAVQTLLARAPAPAQLPLPAPQLDWGPVDQATLEALRAYIPPAITDRLELGQAGWLAELRRMSVLFLGVGGLEAAEIAHFQTCMYALQEVTERYEGSLNKFQVDDKGVIGIVLFGAPPLAHPDDPVRAVRAALDLQQATVALELRLAVGITTGQVFAGPVGSPTRREYTVMGDGVNTAARLMQAAGAGGVFCDAATYQAAGVELHWEARQLLQLKGKPDPVPAYRPIGPASAAEVRSARQGGDRAFVGRAAELALLTRTLDELEVGVGRVFLLEGEAGIGKSRLVGELAAMAGAHGMQILIGGAQSLTRTTPYSAWRELLSTYFDLDHAPGASERRVQTLARLRRIAPDLYERAPLLSDLLGLDMPANELTAGLDPERRQAALTALIVDLLRIRAAERPLVLVLEDVHWLDPLGWALAELVGRALDDLPLLLTLVRRSQTPDDAEPAAEVLAQPQTLRVALGPLALEEAAQLMADRLGVAAIGPNLQALLGQRAAGNPLVIEELALSLRDRAALEQQAGVVDVHGDPAALRLPDSLQSLVLSRLDRLPPDVQLTLRVAAVIGPTFSQAALAQVHPIRTDVALLERHLATLAERELILPLTTGSAGTHRFRQVVLQEMAYTTILPTQRRGLHARVGAWYERGMTEAQSSTLVQLVHHWHEAGDERRELRYATLAGRIFAGEYANAAALNYLERALQLAATDAERSELLWLRLQVNERIGERSAQRADLEQLEQIGAGSSAALDQARLANAWAAYFRDVSDYPAARTRLDAALAAAQVAADPASEARSLTLLGELHEIQGELAEARGRFEQALVVYRSIGYRRGEANNLGTLGRLSVFQGEFNAARELFMQALAIRRAIRDPDECYTLNNLGETAVRLGDWHAGQAYWREAYAAAERVGNRSAAALVLSQLGYAALAQGDYAAALNDLNQAAHVFQLLGERRREAEALNDLGMLYRDLGALEQARTCFERALAIQDAIGDTPNAAFTALNLGRLLIDLNRLRAATLYRRALDYALASGERETEAYARGYLAHLAEQEGDLNGAEAAYRAALELRTELELPLAEEVAGLARVALARGDAAAAAGFAQTALEALEQAGVEGIEFPLLVYLSCYDALRAAPGKPEAARAALAEAHRLLMERAQSIDDPELRRAMLEQAPINRRVVEEFWATRRDAPGAAGR